MLLLNKIIKKMVFSMLSWTNNKKTQQGSDSEILCSSISTAPNILDFKLRFIILRCFPQKLPKILYDNFSVQISAFFKNLFDSS